ncbi:hypothetical protein GCM10027348_21950 [Hymenobacter tenuis]
MGKTFAKMHIDTQTELVVPAEIKSTNALGAPRPAYPTARPLPATTGQLGAVLFHDDFASGSVHGAQQVDARRQPPGEQAVRSRELAHGPSGQVRERTRDGPVEAYALPALAGVGVGQQGRSGRCG